MSDVIGRTRRGAGRPPLAVTRSPVPSSNLTSPFRFGRPTPADARQDISERGETRVGSALSSGGDEGDDPDHDDSGNDNGHDRVAGTAPAPRIGRTGEGLRRADREAHVPWPGASPPWVDGSAPCASSPKNPSGDGRRPTSSQGHDPGYLGDDDVRAALDMGELADALTTALVALSNGATSAPPVAAVAADGLLRAMPGFVPDLGLGPLHPEPHDRARCQPVGRPDHSHRTPAGRAGRKECVMRRFVSVICDSLLASNTSRSRPRAPAAPARDRSRARLRWRS